MSPHSERLRLLQAEKAAESARALADRREAERHTGVAWSGLAPDPRPRRGDQALAQDADARLAALQRWRLSRAGRMLAAMARAERAVEAARACVARGLSVSDARCGLAIGELERAAVAARAAMDATACGALSDGACATSFASSCPSTASSTSSAS
jgi:hypothetical protein